MSRSLVNGKSEATGNLFKSMFWLQFSTWSRIHKCAVSETKRMKKVSFPSDKNGQIHHYYYKEIPIFLLTHL